MTTGRERPGPSTEGKGADSQGDDDGLAARVARECALQGIPAKFDDVEIIDSVIALMVSPNGDGPSKGPRSRQG